MRQFDFQTAGCCLALISALLTPLAHADERNRNTVITFHRPIEIPRVHRADSSVLPAGTYVFKILDSQSNHHIVQILDKDERTIRATILAIPNYRLRATSKTVITFNERSSGQPEALRAWFYPGSNWGEEFVYPKPRAMELAKSAQAPVLSLPPEIPVIEELRRAPIKAIQPTGEEVEVAAVITPSAPNRVVATVVKAPGNLGAAPVVGLAGLIGLAAGISLTLIRKRFTLMEKRIQWAQYCRKFL